MAFLFASDPKVSLPLSLCLQQSTQVQILAEDTQEQSHENSGDPGMTCRASDIPHDPNKLADLNLSSGHTLSLWPFLVPAQCSLLYRGHLINIGQTLPRREGLQIWIGGNLLKTLTSRMRSWALEANVFYRSDKCSITWLLCTVRYDTLP